MLNKLKANSNDFIRMDGDTMAKARHRFQKSLFGKFFGKPPAFDQVKKILLTMWSNLGEINYDIRSTERLPSN